MKTGGLFSLWCSLPSVYTFKESPESSAMKVAWWTLRFCRYATSVTVECCFEVGILNWGMLSCVKGCSSSWHRRGYGHFHSRNPSDIWTRCGPYCSGGDRWQKPAQAGTEASTSGTCTTLQPPGQIGEAGWQTVQPQGPEPLHTRRLEFYFCYYFSLDFLLLTPG